MLARREFQSTTRAMNHRLQDNFAEGSSLSVLLGIKKQLRFWWQFSYNNIVNVFRNLQSIFATEDDQPMCMRQSPFLVLYHVGEGYATPKNTSEIEVKSKADCVLSGKKLTVVTDIFY